MSNVQIRVDILESNGIDVIVDEEQLKKSTLRHVAERVSDYKYKNFDNICAARKLKSILGYGSYCAAIIHPGEGSSAKEMIVSLDRKVEDCVTGNLDGLRLIIYANLTSGAYGKCYIKA